MNTPQMFDAYRVAPETSVLPAYLPLPGLGVLPVNSFVIHGSEPVLIDTGLAALRDEFVAALESRIDPTDLAWIWITHTDADHIGNLGCLLERAPKARVITTYLGMGKLSMLQPVPPDRVYLLNPGQSLVVGDRRPYTIALLVPNLTKLEEWAMSAGVAGHGEAMLSDPRVHTKLEQESLGNLEGFARFERPKKIALLATEFTVESGVLTPTQKVKRRTVEERFGDVIEGLYAEGRAAADER